MTFAAVRRLALALPQVEEGISYGTPAFRVKGKLMARLREDGETLVLKLDMGERDLLMQANPTTFFTTDHYRNYPSVLVRLAKVDASELRELLWDSWRFCAPKRLAAAHPPR
jgi:hypothetical protein